MKSDYEIQPAFKCNNIAIVTSSGEQFCPYAGVLLQSIIENASAHNNYDFVLLHDGISKQRQQEILQIASNHTNISVRFLNVGGLLEGYNFKSVAPYVPPLTCARLLIPEVFSSYFKILWLDSDIVVNRDIADLYNVDISNYYIAAIPEIGMPFFHKKPGHFMIHILDDILKIPPEQYFNGGVQLLNCSALKENYSCEYALKTAARSDFRFLDQDAMNFLCRGKALFLDGRWNVRAKFKDLVDNGPAEIVEKYNLFKKEPYIIHFIGPEKPGENPNVEMNEFFWKYAQHTIYNRVFWKNYVNHMPIQKQTCRKEQSNKLKKVKMRLLPPSSQSFWTMADVESQNFKQVTSQLNTVSNQTKKLENNLLNLYRRVDGNIESEYTNRKFEENKVSFKPREDKVRIVFLFQIASFWPNWESFFNACREDIRFEVKLLYLSDIVAEKSQTQTAKQFLDQNNFEYEEYSEDILYQFRPHIIVLQSPYDTLHRLPEHRAAFFKAHGYRIVYIPYGIEISDTVHARRDHFENPVVKNAWRIYTFSERMKQDYFYRTVNCNNVVSIGHPKFDSLSQKGKFHLPNELQKRIGQRKIMLWHLHFPKVIEENGKKVMCTPMLHEYCEFLNYIKKHKELFFIMLPHPKFTEYTDGKDFINKCADIENLFIDWSDDYRPALYSANYMITDRSAMMIEAGPLEIPILYMSNADYYEPLTAAVQPIVESYYQGNCYSDMCGFANMCLNNLDPKYDHRILALKENLPVCNGNFGQRIRNDIYQALDLEFREYLNTVNMFRLRKALDERISTAEMRARREIRGGFYNLTWELRKNKLLPEIDETFSSEYDEIFYNANRYNSLCSALKILRKLLPALKIKSAVDFGCGSGTWLYISQKLGVNDILGLDGYYINRQQLMIPEQCFMPVDLEKEVTLDRTFDLAISVEVAEHLKKDTAEIFVQSLCNTAPIVIFSAAHPGQGGTNHVNEQPFEYWAEKFKKHGYNSIEIRPLFCDDLEIGYEYRTNITIYAKTPYDERIRQNLF